MRLNELRALVQLSPKHVLGNNRIVHIVWKSDEDDDVEYSRKPKEFVATFARITV
jgi:hypothetical protein